MFGLVEEAERKRPRLESQASDILKYDGDGNLVSVNLDIKNPDMPNKTSTTCHRSNWPRVSCKKSDGLRRLWRSIKGLLGEARCMRTKWPKTRRLGEVVLPVERAENADPWQDLPSNWREALGRGSL